MELEKRIVSFEFYRDYYRGRHIFHSWTCFKVDYPFLVANDKLELVYF
jgi:hypothetical protein